MTDPEKNETLKRPYELHIFVCTNTRPLNPDLAPGERQKASCGPLGAEAVRADLKSWLFEEIQKRSLVAPELKSKFRFRVNGSGCLDFCKKGIAVAIYPESDFILFVKNEASSLAIVQRTISEKLDQIQASIL